jgi:hypothetical protein
MDSLHSLARRRQDQRVEFLGRQTVWMPKASYVLKVPSLPPNHHHPTGIEAQSYDGEMDREGSDIRRILHSRNGWPSNANQMPESRMVWGNQLRAVCEMLPLQVPKQQFLPHEWPGQATLFINKTQDCNEYNTRWIDNNQKVAAPSTKVSIPTITTMACRH